MSLILSSSMSFQSLPMAEVFIYCNATDMLHFQWQGAIQRFYFMYLIYLERNWLGDSLVAVGLKYSQTHDAFNHTRRALTLIWFRKESNSCHTCSKEVNFCSCQIKRHSSKKWNIVFLSNTEQPFVFLHSMCKYSYRAYVVCLSFNSLTSAVIVTHLCTASTFFTLLSWLPTFFKDTFPDAKVTTPPFHPPVDHTLDLWITGKIIKAK